jgi:hypothetical protein
MNTPAVALESGVENHWHRPTNDANKRSSIPSSFYYKAESKTSCIESLKIRGVRSIKYRTRVSTHKMRSIE